jgi:hypothetical protein
MLLNLKDFSKATGVSYDTLRQHLRRKKVYKSGDFIDTEFNLNQLYINDQTNGKGIDLSKITFNETTNENTKTKTKSKPDQDKKTSKPKVESPPDVRVDSSVSQEDIMHHSLNLRKKRADAEKAEKENELKSLEIAKKMGELMPIDMVEKILMVNIRTIVRESVNEWENIASVYCEILGGNRSHLSQMVEQMNKHMDKMVKDVKKKSGDEIKQVIKDYAEVRSRGQRK